MARDQVRAKDGTIHWAETHASPYRNASGEVEGIVASFRLIDEAVAAEEELRRSEERYRLLAENARDVIWTMEPDGRISYVSPSIQLLRGLTPEEAMRQPLELIHPPASLRRSK
jgi:PAS domain-containing protein